LPARPIELRPVVASDAVATARLLEDPDVQRFTPLQSGTDYAVRLIDRYLVARREGTREMFVIAGRQSGDFLGLAMAPRIDRSARSVELGYMVLADRRGRGVASEALRQLAEWAIKATNARRAELRITVDNGASRSVAERCGFVIQETLEPSCLKNRRVGTEIWSKLLVDA
jgi:RimJ/RimL family protein N-acetyltransferase